MSHSFHKILIHAIWSTKNRAAFIWPEIEAAVYQFMKEQFTNQDCLPLATARLHRVAATN